jgi:hypothetical protein
LGGYIIENSSVSFDRLQALKFPEKEAIRRCSVVTIILKTVLLML